MKRWLIVGAVFAAMLCVIVAQGVSIHKIKQQRERNARNVSALMADVRQYRTRDSLNAAKVNSLELTLRDYERFRAEDAATIKALQTKNRDLQRVTTTQTHTIMALAAQPKDTIIVRDSVKMSAIAVHSGDAWYDFDGLLADGMFSGTLNVRDSLLLVETVKYKRFWGFLWKTKKVKDRHLDVVSRNPHTKIIGIEHIIVE